MESPVVVDKPPEYGNMNNERGFPFDEEDGSGAWSQLAARHPDIAARLRARPQAWQRKRRPSGHETDDFGDEFSGFDRFPFDDIPPEFREHFPQHFRREQPPAPQPPPQSPQHQTSSTQTEQPSTSTLHPQDNLPQYGLRNTVDLGQKSPVDPSVADAEDRGQRSMSAPPETRNAPNMSHQVPPPQAETSQQPPESHSNVRHIPIFVEGRDEPVINKTADHGVHYADPKPTYVPPPHVDREQYFTDDIPVGFNHPQNFSRAFGTPFKGFRQGPQPFVQQKVYPQTAFARANSPHRSQSPKPQQEEFVKVPVHHENKPAPKPAQHPKPQQQAPPPQPHSQPQPQPQPQQAPPPKPTPSPNDPITQILAVQTDVLNLMTEVENFTGSKRDKRYMYLDEMLTRNLIKLDTIETDGKENIRQARKEAIKCIQKCIAVLEAKAEKGSQAQDIEMKENAEAAKVENGEETKEEKQEPEAPPTTESEPQPQPQVGSDVAQTPQAADTRPEESKEAPADGGKKKKASPKKKRDKSKETKPEQSEEKANAEVMQVDDKGDKSVPNQQTMEVDGAAASQ